MVQIILMVHHDDLSCDCSDGERLYSVLEELVQKREEHAQDRPENPYSEGEHWQRRVVCGRHGQSHLFD